ncbi:MAG: flagellar protein export ATPase FliI [Rhodospirillales bacterium]|nr:MAG: flagellar protein export ATPase FliI [Rhodospirillales bacterium]
MSIETLVQEIAGLPEVIVHGRVTSVIGLLVEADGLEGTLAVGDRCRLVARNGPPIPAEVIGVRDGRVLVMPLGSPEGIGLGSRVEAVGGGGVIHPDPSWLGRIVDAFGRPLDGRGPMLRGPTPQPLRAAPPPAHGRQRLGGPIDLGIRVVDTFLACCRGQRMGVFAGSGVGKSTLLSMLARHADLEVNVIGLVGERGREAREFIEDDLGPEGLARSVVVVATSDEPPLVRRQAAYTMMALAEYFRDRGHQVLCLMDSVTRFAMAQREIGLAAGEPPTTKGYTPSAFAELPRLLERAGPGAPGKGSITGVFAVLVDGDDHNEPVADAVRGILDGHIVLDRSIAERGRFPPVNVLRSVSRSMPACHSEAQTALIKQARNMISTYEDMAELIRLGAYRQGSDPAVDEAIKIYPSLEQFLAQNRAERTDTASAFRTLAGILGAPSPDGADPDGA